MRKLLAIIVAVALFASTAMASDISESADNTVQLNTSAGTISTVTSAAYNDLVFISEEEAEEIALLFVQDATSFDYVNWNSDTSVTRIVKMYDETAERNITAYTVELDTGYVVVSAYADAESLIPEWSDRDAPVYSSSVSYDAEQILYLGAFKYYLDAGGTAVEDLNGNNIEKAELINDVELSRDASNIPSAVIDSYIEAATINPGISTASTITDPFDHANNNYSGPFESYDYVNLWENYALFYTTGDFKTVNGVTYNNHCGPTAITNLMCMYQYKYRGIKNGLDAAKTIFNYVAQYGINNAYYNNSSSIFGGTTDTGAAAYIRNVFSNYLGVTTSTQLRDVTYSNFRNTFEYGRLMYLMLHSHEEYGNHHVAGYAYTRLRSQTTGWFKTYLKVCDGWGHGGRYIDVASISDDSAYYEVSFG